MWDYPPNQCSSAWSPQIPKTLYYVAQKSTRDKVKELSNTMVHKVSQSIQIFATQGVPVKKSETKLKLQHSLIRV